MASKKSVKIGDVLVGGGAPVSVQSMTNTDTRDVFATIAQIERLCKVGCEIVRIAVPDMDAAKKIKEIKEKSKIPIICDIHFDYRLAIKAIEEGADGIRINPGNIGGERKVKEIVSAAKMHNIPIRVGINSGSLEKEVLSKYGGPNPSALFESAVKNVRLLESFGFYEIKVSLKSSSVIDTIEAYRKVANVLDYPLHLGVTEAGPPISSAVKSSICIGTLLLEGIGDTIRVSVTGDPEEEVRIGFHILRALGLRKRGVDIISCPTCGRCSVDLISIVKEIEEFLSSVDKPLKVAIMGCVVNGPREAKSADIGVAFGKNLALLFKKGEIIDKISYNDLKKRLIKEIEDFCL